MKFIVTFFILVVVASVLAQMNQTNQTNPNNSTKHSHCFKGEKLLFYNLQKSKSNFR